MTLSQNDYSKKFRIDFLDIVIGNKLCYTGSTNDLKRWSVVFTTETEELITDMND